MIQLVNLVIERLKAEGICYSDKTDEMMDEAMGLVADKLGISQYQFEVELAMIQGGYDSFDESAEYVGANGLWDCIDPLASFELIWERLTAMYIIEKEMQDSFFLNKTRDILISAIERAERLIITDF
jgi:hypothetical protein